MLLMTWSSILSAMDCRCDFDKVQQTGSGQMNCHNDGDSDTQSANDTMHCQHLGCNVATTTPYESSKLNYLPPDDLTVLTIKLYPSIPQSNIFHPPKT